jgi:myo-inositol-1(or 4)-monophosphatase
MNYMEKMIPIVQLVGDEVMRYYRTAFKIVQKNPWSFYSEVDILSQKMLQEELQSLIPGSGYIAEELEVYDKQEFTWVIDPIDGTRNFVRGMPYFGISVALMEHDEVIAGVVYMPAMHDMISAQKGMGLWVNGQKFSPDFTRYQQQGAMIVSGAIKRGKRDLSLSIKQVLKPIEPGVRFRACGAAAVDLAYAAMGVYDVVLFENLKWWDVAAGILLVTEAGGHVSDYQNKLVNGSFKTLIAGNRTICTQILDGGIL